MSALALMMNFIAVSAIKESLARASRSRLKSGLGLLAKPLRDQVSWSETADSRANGPSGSWGAAAHQEKRMTTPTLADQTELAIEREALRERLRREFHISALFIPVKTVAAVLGLSPSTIYAYIRVGEFFLPYRLINKTPMVALDDLVSWCLQSNDWRQAAPKAEPTLLQVEPAPDLASFSERLARHRDSPVDRAVAETLSQLGLAPRRVKSTRR